MTASRPGLASDPSTSRSSDVEPSELVWAHTAHVDVEMLLRELASETTFAWTTREGVTIVAAGVAERIACDGTRASMDALRERLRRKARATRITGTPPPGDESLRAYGGLAFDRERPSDDAWAPFGAGAFFIPRYLYVADRKSAYSGVFSAVRGCARDHAPTSLFASGVGCSRDVRHLACSRSHRRETARSATSSAAMGITKSESRGRLRSSRRGRRRRSSSRGQCSSKSDKRSHLSASSRSSSRSRRRAPRS